MKKKYLLLGLFLIQATSIWAMDEEPYRPAAKVGQSLHGDEIANIQRYAVAVEQEGENLHDLANHNYQLVFGGQTFSKTVDPVIFPKEEATPHAALPPAFLDHRYGKVAAFNKLLHLTHDLSSDSQNKPQHALMTLFGNSSGEINFLWKTSPFAWEYHKERPGGIGALYNRLERYTEPPKKYTIFKTHVNLVKAIAENLLLFKKKNIICENTNGEIKKNIELFGKHMRLLSKIISAPNISYWALQDDLTDYRQWLGDIESNTSRADLLVEAYSGLYDWEVLQSSEFLQELME